MTNPDMVPAMRKVAAIVTDEGGMTCHAAIVSRELGTPAVVGTKTATHVLKTGQMVTVDGEMGLIYEGEIRRAPPAPAAAPGQGGAATGAIITATSVKVNVSIPEAAVRAAATGADGVGLLRIEHLILGLNKTPGWFITNNKEEDFVRELHDGIKIVLDAFPGKPVWVRTLDAPTDEFRNMMGGRTSPMNITPCSAGGESVATSRARTSSVSRSRPSNASGRKAMKISESCSPWSPTPTSLSRQKR